MVGVAGRSGPPGNRNAEGNSGGGAPLGNRNAIGNASGGAHPGNMNAATHGLYSHLHNGKWPVYAQEAGLPEDLSSLRVQLEEAVSHRHGGISIKRAALIQSATRHEGAVRLLMLWLEENPGLPIETRTRMLGQIATLTDKRDASIKGLDLDEAEASRSLSYAFLAIPQPQP